MNEQLFSLIGPASRLERRGTQDVAADECASADAFPAQQCTGEITPIGATENTE